jgi:protoporphyrinogen oxidase
MYFGPYSKKLWGIPPNMISSAWADQRISLISLWDVLARLLGKRKNEPKTYAGRFYYPKRGIGQICEKMAGIITKNAGKIHLNTRMEDITVTDGRVENVLCVKDGEQLRMKGDYFISTIALPDFVRALRPRVDEKLYAIADKMDFRSIRFLFLFIDKPRITDNTWIYIPEKKFIFFRIQEIGNWSPFAVPDDKTGLTLEIACNEDDEIWNADAEYLYSLCLESLKELKLLEGEGLVSGYFDLKVKYCYPMYTLDYFYKTNSLLSFISRFTNAISIGRQGLYRYNNIDHSIKMGLLAARHIIEDLPKEEIFQVATEKKIFDWQDPGR